MSPKLEHLIHAMHVADLANDGPPYERMARAALKALREPSEDMIDARFSVLGQGGKAEWEAMIDAVLGEEAP
jgi:hypothetical protein